MSRIPTVAIIGRPNTGKSTLFNRIVGKKRAIVNEFAGTTRDHVVFRVERPDMDFLLLDTGGIGGGSNDRDFEDDVSMQSLIAMQSADLILFTVNSKEELTSSDHAVVEMLRKRKRKHVPVIIVPTKCDHFDAAKDRMAEYFSLNVTEHIIPISAVHNLGMDELESTLTHTLKELHFEKTKEDVHTRPRIALVGKPNVGKSSIINALMSDPQRELSSRIVSDIPGTTRDSSDTIIKHHSKEYVFVDTAGLRRQARVDEQLESISAIKSFQALQDSDIVLLTIDAHDFVSKQDKRIASMAIEEGKGVIILINKADLLNAEERKEKEIEVRVSLQFCKFAPILFVSAVTREGLLKMFPLLERVYQNLQRRLPQKELMYWFETAANRIPANQLARSKFITQAEGTPPTFVLFVKNPKKVEVSQLRYLDNSMRAVVDFVGVPLRWITKGPAER